MHIMFQIGKIFSPSFVVVVVVVVVIVVVAVLFRQQQQQQLVCQELAVPGPAIGDGTTRPRRRRPDDGGWNQAGERTEGTEDPTEATQIGQGLWRGVRKRIAGRGLDRGAVGHRTGQDRRQGRRPARAQRAERTAGRCLPGARPGTAATGGNARGTKRQRPGGEQILLRRRELEAIPVRSAAQSAAGWVRKGQRTRWFGQQQQQQRRRRSKRRVDAPTGTQARRIDLAGHPPGGTPGSLSIGIDRCRGTLLHQRGESTVQGPDPSGRPGRHSGPGDRVLGGRIR
mmetsp:Transcript_24503/g.53663  ORF Transcript_24503/g.53663 Transcript_24503/m.53663 type:complete len:284 (-) Transcript_24503:1292-2143(-)